MLTGLPDFPWLSRCVASPFRRAAGNERGIATFVAALLALLATGTTAATLTLANGGVDFDRVSDVVAGAVGQVSGTLELRGSVIARSDDSSIASIVQVPLRFYGEGPVISLEPDNPERLLIAYVDERTYAPDLPYTVQALTGDGDGLLEPGETALLTIDLSTMALRGGERFTIELSAPVGGTLIVQRRLPAILQPVMSLN